jgi:predicted cupin superfamily sugar epimerase
MHARAAQLIEQLSMQPHPEGGYYREVYRSPSQVQPADARPRRSALTTIYFLLVEGQHSRWHRVDSDEVWHFYEGDPLHLASIRPDAAGIESHTLGIVGDSARPVRVIPAGVWQAARSTGAYTLVGCTVGPGFDFADFEMLADRPQDIAKLEHAGDEFRAFL